MNKFFTAAVVLTASVLSFTACDKDEPHRDPITTAKIEVLSKTTVFFDFKSNTVQEDPANAMVSLSGMYGSDLKNNQPDKYSMAYFDMKNTSIEELTLASILSSKLILTNSLGIDASSAGAPPKGPTWIIYDSPNGHAVYPTADRYIVMYTGDVLNAQVDELYVIQAGDITALKGDAIYNLNFKKFVK